MRLLFGPDGCADRVRNDDENDFFGAPTSSGDEQFIAAIIASESSVFRSDSMRVHHCLIAFH